jgi:hypothetical protein
MRLLRPHPQEGMNVYWVSALANNPANDSPCGVEAL